jgi:hypothetical protein
MDRKYFKATLFAYSAIAILCFSLIIGIGYFFWQSQLFSAETIVYKYQSSSRIKKLAPEIVSKEVNELLAEGKAGPLLQWLDRAKQDIDFVNHQFPEHELDHPLENSRKQFEDTVKNLKTSTGIRKLYLILDRKVRKFKTFVKSNGWRTLTRMSGRIVARLSALQLGNISSFKKSIKRTQQEIVVMRNVTESSVLSRSDKSRILIKLNSLNTEIKLFDQYLDRHALVERNSNSFLPQVQKWYSIKAPAISKALLNIEKNSRILAFAILLGTIGTLLVLVSGFFWVRKNLNYLYSAMGKDLIKIIQRDVLSSVPKLNGIEDSEVKRDLTKLNEYTQRRLKFGNYLKDSLPLATVMIDSNFKAVWANEQFCEEWGVGSSDIQNDMVSWDFLIRSTNLDEADPVKEAIYEGVGGIFQILLKKNRNKSAVPFEMFVTPVETEGEKIVMAYFYDLSSQMDTIRNQATSIIAPIKNLIQFYFSGSKKASDYNEIKKSFENSGLSNLFDKFSKEFEQEILYRNSLISQIDELEEEVQDQIKLMRDLKVHQARQNEEYVEFLNTLSSLKNSVIGLFEVFANYHSLSNQFGGLLVEIHNLAGIKSKRVEKYEEHFEDIFKALPNLEEFKGNMGEVKTQMELAKARTLESLDQSQSFKKSTSGQEVSASLEKIKRNLKDFFVGWEQSEKVVSQLDIRLSKSKIIFEDTRTFVGEREDLGLDHQAYAVRVEQLRANLDELSQSSESIESEIVNGFKDLYSNIRRFLEKGHDFTTMVSSYEKDVPTAIAAPKEASRQIEI